MRLSELTAYRNHPIYKAASNLRPSDKVDFDPSFTSYDIDTMEEFIQVMESHGWEKISGGHFSNVFRHPNYQYVVKVFVADRGYREYFQYVKAHQSNPHVPIVRGNLIKIGDRGYAVRMEPLDEIDGQNDPMFQQYIMPGITGYFVDKPATTLFQKLTSFENQQFLEQEWPELAEVIDYVGDGDWRLANLMKRGNILVITDPWAD